MGTSEDFLGFVLDRGLDGSQSALYYLFDRYRGRGGEEEEEEDMDVDPEVVEVVAEDITEEEEEVAEGDTTTTSTRSGVPLLSFRDLVFFWH